jgi:methylmalonyl-CoA/ethylmalonyl-CoA epimerase
MSAVAGTGVSRIGQIGLTTGDLPRAVAFYRDVVGLRFLFEAPPQMAFFECGGTRLMLSAVEGAGPAAGQQFNSILYYTVDDIHGAARDLERRGARVERQPHVVAPLPAADLWMAFFRDPDGNLFALMSEVPRA